MRQPSCLAALSIALLLPASVRAADSGAGAGLRLPPLAADAQAQSGQRGLQLPATISADRIEGISDKEVMATGNAEFRRGDLLVGADALEYSSEADEIRARGNVRIEREGVKASGPALRYRMKDGTGRFEQPSYSLSRRKVFSGVVQSGQGSAELLEFKGENQYHLTDATFTTCKPGSGGWYVKAGQLDLDMTRDTGEARGAAIYFQNTPILYAPWMSFSLNDERKSGFLPPHVGSTSQGGPEISVPYYFNIAPNMDLTVLGRYMQKRGAQVNGDFRFMNEHSVGQFKMEVLPDDKVLNRQRSALALNHNYANGSLVGGLNVNKVSDDSYFRDLSSRINLTAQTNLLREGFLGYTGNWWGSGTYGATLRVQKFQTLQDPNSPVSKPYARTPQITMNALRQDLMGLDLNIAGEYVDFSHPTQVVGRRVTAYPSLSFPLLSAGAFLTPKIGVHNTHYSLDRNAAGTDSSIGRSIPIISVDSGLVFERDTRVGGNSFVQTLEPRAYYLRVPYQNQDRIPLFDTAVADFNYAQIFSENSFVGGDRINDANQVTFAMTSRLLHQGSGQEVLRGTLGQRYYLSKQEVTLNPGDTRRSYKSSDWLAALSGRLTQHWTAETAAQFNPREQRSERLNLSARYQPETFKLLNLSYRYLRDQLGQIDVSAQWPLGGGFYGVGRYNYSLKDRRVIETLGGLEYNGDCWVLRGVMQRFATATGQTTNTFFLQLELSGFSRIGSNPLEALKRNIPGYSRLNQAPSRNQTVDLFD
jgi:LPS-assembly protein